MDDTRSDQYTRRLTRVQGARWKRYAPNPYRWWLRSQDLGFVLDIGCGLGRSLAYLDGHGVGIDHNPDFVAACRERGLQAYTPDEFADSGLARIGGFDSLICLHVLEHLAPGEPAQLLSQYLPYLKPGGKVVLITPQERGYASDSTHTVFIDGEGLVGVARGLGLSAAQWHSFPFPRWAGKLFIYNEFQLLAHKPAEN